MYTSEYSKIPEVFFVPNLAPGHNDGRITRDVECNSGIRDKGDNVTTRWNTWQRRRVDWSVSSSPLIPKRKERQKENSSPSVVTVTRVVYA
jgi:hypothetical protein